MMTVSRPALSAPAMSICIRVGISEGGAANTPPKVLCPVRMPATVTTRMPMMIAPGTLR